MIILTRLDGKSVAVNEDLMVFVEQTPDTVLTMSSGQRLMVKEPLSAVIDLIAAFRRSCVPPLVPGGMSHG